MHHVGVSLCLTRGAQARLLLLVDLENRVLPHSCRVACHRRSARSAVAVAGDEGFFFLFGGL